MKKATGGLPRENQYPYSPYNSYSGICSETDLVYGPKVSLDLHNLNEK